MNIATQLKQMGFKPDQIAGALVDGKPLAAVEEKKPKSEMNKTEALYALELDALLRENIIASWKFESIKLRLAKRTWYTPDFFVIPTIGRPRFVEIKGFLRDDAAIKFKLAREAYPWADFVMLRRVKGQWVKVNI